VVGLKAEVVGFSFTQVKFVEANVGGFDGFAEISRDLQRVRGIGGC